MLVGSNMPIFGGGRYPAVSLRLRLETKNKILTKIITNYLTKLIWSSSIPKYESYSSVVMLNPIWLPSCVFQRQ